MASLTLYTPLQSDQHSTNTVVQAVDIEDRQYCGICDACLRNYWMCYLLLMQLCIAPVVLALSYTALMAKQAVSSLLCIIYTNSRGATDYFAAANTICSTGVSAKLLQCRYCFCLIERCLHYNANAASSAQLNVCQQVASVCVRCHCAAAAEHCAAAATY
eukprot:2447-Heterococcus_DN1.PRE.2